MLNILHIMMDCCSSLILENEKVLIDKGGAKE